MARPWNKRKFVVGALGALAVGSCVLSLLIFLGLGAAKRRLEPEDAGWEDAARTFHERAAREKALDLARRSPVLVGAVASGNAAQGYVRALQLCHEQENAPWIGRSPNQLARIRPGGEPAIGPTERAYVDSNRSAVAALVSAVHCADVSWGVDFESDPEHMGLPGPRLKLFSSAVSPLGYACLAVAREKALAGDAEGALEHVLAAARWAIDECPARPWQRASVTVSSADHLAWLSTKLPPGRLGAHAAEIRRALDALEARIPGAAERIAQERFEHERHMLVIGEGMERTCEQIPLVGTYCKPYSVPIARAFAAREEGLNVQRELYLEGEKAAAATADPLERRRALEAVDARWPRARPEDPPSGSFAWYERAARGEHARLALVRAVLEVDEGFAREGRAPAEWTLAREPGSEAPWVYQPREDGQAWRVVRISVGEILFGASGPSLVVLFER